MKVYKVCMAFTGCGDGGVGPEVGVYLGVKGGGGVSFGQVAHFIILTKSE